MSEAPPVSNAGGRTHLHERATRIWLLFALTTPCLTYHSRPGPDQAAGAPKSAMTCLSEGGAAAGLSSNTVSP